MSTPLDGGPPQSPPGGPLKIPFENRQEVSAQAGPRPMIGPSWSGQGSVTRSLHASASNSWWYALLAVPVGIYFALVAAYGVNVVFEDSWNSIVLLLGSFEKGRLSLAMLWAPHNESRMLFPYLLFLLSDLPSRYNATVDLYLSAAFMTLAMFLLCALVGWTTGLKALWLVPIGLLFLDPVQIENMLWDFQLAWTMIALLFVVCLLCIEGTKAYRYLWLLAAVAASIASFSSLQGLLIWPAALVYAWARGRGARSLVIWSISGIAVSFLYAWHLGNVEPKAWSTFPYHHPFAVLRYFLIAVGNWAPRLHTEAGVAVLATVAVIAWVAARRPAWRGPLAVTLALAAFALLFSALTAWGRSALGPAEALDSRYTTYSIWAPIGVYIVAAVYLDRTWSGSLSPLSRHDGAWARVLYAATVAAVVLEIVWAVPHAIAYGQAQRTRLDRAAVELRDYRTATDAQLQVLFGPGGGFVKQWAPILQEHGWSVFASRGGP